jgi:signal transduction histidine kinase
VAFICVNLRSLHMPLGKMISRIRSTDIQVKVVLILIAVIFPLSILIGFMQSTVMEPILSDEVRQLGVSFSQNLSSQIQSQRLLSKTNPTPLIEDLIQRMMYTQPSVLRVDVITQKPNGEGLYYVASSVEEQEGIDPPIQKLNEEMVTEVTNEEGIPVWSVYYPVKQGTEKANIHILVSLRFVKTITATIWRINLIGALVSTILLILILSFFLRRAIENEKQLKVAQMSNEVLSEKLQEIQQELIHKEKLAVMGQLTASFAHEIGTPLNAISGHVQLLNMDLGKTHSERIGIISGQLKKIEEIVKGFLLTTKTPIVQQKITITTTELIERIVVLVMPTLQRHQISFGQEFKAKDDTVEVVPLEIEQVLLNLVNNAIDSMKSSDEKKDAHHALWIRTYNTTNSVTIEIQDTGSGISPDHLKQIFKPFFTTKNLGEGHGLGLSICQQIVRSYGGEILVESSLKRGTKMKVQLPVGEKV